ncbi:multicopper oxidase [Coniella lustricola]|uniref:Multicopper oxidase n=1 Tax=Coniella lustricola TaxID=2025994 RepID=A0A2T2ZRX8_9PEZI|nr:multicopper oxidase [Coniella lustricola]
MAGRFVAAVALCASLAWAKPHSAPRQTTDTTSVCAGNTADDRSVWCDYSIDTNYYEEVPNTGVTREYWFELQNGTAAPDGIERNVLTVNGSIPGPTIIADWGDEVIVHVTNSLSANGSSVHFHGIRQNFTNPSDGVTSITQCPTAPGDTVTYKWRATQYGSSWYHSHFAYQAYEGVFGGIIINGPATANYDYDLGNLFLLDWSHQTIDQLSIDSSKNGPPTMDNGLINGTNIYVDTDNNNETVGARWEATFEAGSSYRLRLVNSAVDSMFDFSIDNHTLEVISIDFVPIVPYTTDVISIGMGQRYDVIVTADQSAIASDFWMRAYPDSFCSDNANPDDIKGIIHYGSSTATPTTTGYTTGTSDCADQPAESLVPYLSMSPATSFDVTNDLDVSLSIVDDWIRWAIGETSFQVYWDNPTALQVFNNVTAFNETEVVIELPTANEWTYLLIENSNAVTHPIHLHGHDFYILGADNSAYTSADTATLNYSNPPRRDVAMLPPNGWLAIAFQADNPGIWLMHCHIAWHTDQGFALQWLERRSEIEALYDETSLRDSCASWDAWDAISGETQEGDDDDGI